MRNFLRSLLARRFRISYSQLAEDIIASEILSRRRGVTYVDIGANHPIFGSNSFYFYLRGGRGVCVEPNQAFAPLYRSLRPRDQFVASAVSDSSSPKVFFTNSGKSTDAFTSFEVGDQKPDAHVTEVNNLHINAVLSLVGSPSIDFLSLDTETMDARIIQAIDYAKYRISVICVETNKSEAESTLISDFLKEHGYRAFATNPINTLFAHDAWLSPA